MSLKKNFIYNTIYQVFIMLLPLITVPYISRIFGANGVGLYSYNSSYSQYFILLGMIGISLYGNRQIAYNKDDKVKMSREFWNIYTLQAITTSISLIVYVIIFVFINKSNVILYLINCLPIIGSIFDISWFFIGYEDIKKVVIRNSLTKVLGIICIFIFVKSPNDIGIYALIMGLTVVLGQLIMWISLPKKVIFIKPIFKDVVSHLRPSIKLFVSQLAIQVYVLLDRTMLGFMTDNYQVGIYDNSQKVIKVVLMLVTSIGTVMLPRMSNMYANGKILDLKKMIYKVFEFINFISVPMTLGIIAISKGFSIWFYGDKFIGVDILMQIGALIVLAISWSSILGVQVMLPMKMEKEYTLSVTAGAIVNMTLNFILIRNYLAIGTTISTVIAEFTVTLIQIYYLRRIIDLKIILKSLIKPIIASFVMFLVVINVNNFLPINILSTILESLIGFLVYIILMYIMKDKFLLSCIKAFKKK